MNKPPSGVDVVMDAVMTFLERPTGWTSVKKELNDTKFLDRIMDFNKDGINSKVLKKIESFTKESDFTPELMNKKSAAAGALCIWVRAIEDYAKCLKIVNPKREKKAIAEATVKRLRENLAEYEKEFAVLKAKLDLLQATIDKKAKQMDELKASLGALQSKIDRGEKLVSSLADEKANWIIKLEGYNEEESCLFGDCVMAAAFMSYGGPFPFDYRTILNKKWLEKISDEHIKISKGYQFIDFLSSKALARKWQ